MQLWDFRWDALGEGYSAEIQGGGDGERGLRKAGREEPVPRGALLLLQAIKLGCIIPYPLPSPPNPKEVLAIQATVQKNRAWFSGEEFELIPPRGWEKKKKSHTFWIGSVMSCDIHAQSSPLHGAESHAPRLT